MSISSETLDRIRSQLREATNSGGSFQQDLYSHLTEVFNRIVEFNSGDAYEKFEEISTLVKRTRLNFNDPKRDFELNGTTVDANAGDQARINWIQKSKNLLNEIFDSVSKSEKTLLSRNQKFSLPNLQEEAEMLEWAGVSFGEEFTYKLGKSMKRLAVMSGAQGLRFMGKIYGSKKDYLIVDGALPNAEELSTDKMVEPRGQGVNARVYWVTDNLFNDWVQLPDCKPEHIAFARLIKHVMVGDLNATIDSNPPFPGKERHFLRAQIARIFHATLIAPKGFYEIDEETQQMKYSEEFTLPGTEELKSLEVWGNVNALILQAGRTTHAAPSHMAEEEKEEYLAKLAEEDKTEERFRGANEHVPMPGMETAWLSKVTGDAQQYTKGDGTVTYAVNVIRSLRWPGAITVAKGGKFTSIYVGYGLKKGDSSYNPTEPPEVQKDPQDQNEMPEPTPLNAPQEPAEPDTDAEKPKEEDEEDE